jgi:MFS family permease
MTTETTRLRPVAAPVPVTPRSPRPGRLSSGLASLANPDYRLFFGGSLVSNIGMWMQTVAQGWLVVTLTNSSFLVGLVGFFAMAPNLLFGLFGGVLADRVDKRRILMTTQTVSAALVAVLATLIATGRVQLWHVMAISFGAGTMMALGSPAWQAIVPELVGKERLLNAIALNSTQFNLTRVIGPSLGGVMIRFIGVAGSYYANALSYLVFLAALRKMRPQHALPIKQGEQEGVFRSLHRALRYAWNRRIIRTALMLAAAQTLFLYPYVTLLPLFAKNVLGMGASGYALLLSMAGAGALLGALTLAFRGEVRRKGRLMLVAQVVFAVAVAAFALSRTPELSMLALFFVGWALVTFLATGNTLLQTLVPDELRGRVMSIWMLAGFGFMPIGSLQAGAVASVASPSVALVAGAALTLAFTALVMLWSRELYRYPDREGDAERVSCG